MEDFVTSGPHRSNAANAEAYFLERVAAIVGNLDGLERSDNEYAFTLRVPASRLHDVSRAIATLQLDVEDRFGLTISTLPVPMPG